MATRQEVILKGLTHSPSDYDCQDGELATCLNLINEDGALHPIHQPVVAEQNITLDAGDTIELVHKVTHNETIHSHYIIRKSDDTWYWMEKGGDGTKNTIDLNGFHVNAVTAVGNILSFVGDSKILYCYWDNGVYRVVDFTEVTYDAKLTRTSFKMSVDSWVKDNTITEQGYTLPLEDFDSYGFPEELGENVTTRLFASQDAYVNKYMDSYSFKYIQFAILAIQLYDGSYIQIGNPFILAPKERIEDSIGFRWTRDGGGMTSGNLNLTYEADNIYATYKGQEIDNYELSVNIKDIDKYKTLIKGVDMFISNTLFPYNTKGNIIAKENYFYFRNDKGRMKISDYSYINGKFVMGVRNYHYQPYTEEEIYEKIDNLSFYKSTSFSFDDVKDGTSKKLKRVLGTEDSLPIADLQRESYGAMCAITYNNRLHLGNVMSSITTRCNNGNGYYSPVAPNMSLVEDSYQFLFRYEPKGQFNGNYIDNFGTDQDGSNCIDKICQVVSKVYLKINNKDEVFSYYDELHYPLPPILSFPSNKAKVIDLLIRIPERGSFSCYKKSFSLYESETFGFNYAVNYSNGTFCPIQANNVTMNYESWTVTISQDPSWKKISEEEFNKEKANIKESTINGSRTPSLVKVSEAENPLVFPAKNSVQVGSSIVSAMAANTRPISEGQFGDAPLYAFTDEGVWVLMLGSEGTYIARQPANRDICSNPKGILQIDDAVLYPTERGIMMQRGRESENITDALDDYPFDFRAIYSHSTKDKTYPNKLLALGNIPESDVKYVRFRKYLEEAGMIYDYYDSRIIVFNPNYTYAYVYSLKSNMWGTLHNVFNKRVNIYPESYATDKEGKILDVYVKEPTENVPFFLCSRPLTLGQDVYKTLFDCITRGYFSSIQAGKCGTVLFGSNDLVNWYYVGSSVNMYLRNLVGSPYKYFRLALMGSLAPKESISALSIDFQPRLQNKLR